MSQLTDLQEIALEDEAPQEEETKEEMEQEQEQDLAAVVAPTPVTPRPVSKIDDLQWKEPPKEQEKEKEPPPPPPQQQQQKPSNGEFDWKEPEVTAPTVETKQEEEKKAKPPVIEAPPAPAQGFAAEFEWKESVVPPPPANQPQTQQTTKVEFEWVEETSQQPAIATTTAESMPSNVQSTSSGSSDSNNNNSSYSLFINAKPNVIQDQLGAIYSSCFGKTTTKEQETASLPRNPLLFGEESLQRLLSGKHEQVETTSIISEWLQETVAEIIGKSSASLASMTPNEQIDIVNKRAEVLDELLAKQLEFVTSLETIWKAHGEPLLNQPSHVLTKEEWSEGLGLSSAQNTLVSSRVWLEKLSCALVSEPRGHAHVSKVAKLLIESDVLSTISSLCSHFRSSVDCYGKLLNNPNFASMVLNSQRAGNLSLPTLFRNAIDSLPQYDTLFNKIVSFTWKSHPDFEELPIAIQSFVSSLQRAKEIVFAQETRSEAEKLLQEQQQQPQNPTQQQPISPQKPFRPKETEEMTQQLQPEELSTMSDEDLREELRKLIRGLAESDKRLRLALEERERLRTEKELYGLQVQQLIAVLKHDEARSSQQTQQNQQEQEQSSGGIFSLAFQGIPSTIMSLIGLVSPQTPTTNLQVSVTPSPPLDETSANTLDQ